jgi:NADPH:quinone reductase
MKAVVCRKFGTPDALAIESVPYPSLYADNLIVKIASIGVNPVDTYFRMGERQVTLPFIPGFDASGIVESLGKNVIGFEKGQKVYISGVIGTYAEYISCPASSVYPLPPKFSFDEGSAIGIPYATAYYGLFHLMRLKKNDSILINGGSGAVGIALVQLCELFGINVYASSGSQKGSVFLKSLGVKASFNHNDTDFEHEIKEICSDKKIGTIFEMKAEKNLNNDMAALEMNGKIVIIGSQGNCKIHPKDLMKKNLTILGYSYFNISKLARHSIYKKLNEYFSNCAFRPQIAHAFPLKDAAKAHKKVQENLKFGKVILKTDFH